MARSSGLPDESVVEILARLPVDSLMRFKLVSTEEENVLSLLSFDYKTERSLGEDHVPVFWKIIELSSYKNSGLVYILGHFHGIICLTSDDCGAIVLANPSITRLRELPQSRNRPSHQFPSVRSLCVGFGYDPKFNYYEVVQYRLRGGLSGLRIGLVFEPQLSQKPKLMDAAQTQLHFNYEQLAGRSGSHSTVMWILVYPLVRKIAIAFTKHEQVKSNN
ncbi:hypothetical protein WN944_018249 [Citrus x changshan-huyou]|uniref:F-box domain-containing protein n=1 Tax=Citrus x changshan-huyou TaxID=2935761 RepID=A0AAP0QDZ1_9ROSI